MYITITGSTAEELRAKVLNLAAVYGCASAAEALLNEEILTTKTAPEVPAKTESAPTPLPAAETEVPKRYRRTKAEIEAEKAAAAQSAASVPPANGSTSTAQVAQAPTPAPAAPIPPADPFDLVVAGGAAPTPAPASTVTIEDARIVMNDVNTKLGTDHAIKLLKSCELDRFSSIKPEQLAKFVANGQKMLAG